MPEINDGQMGLDGVMRYWNGFEYVAKKDSDANILDELYEESLRDSPTHMGEPVIWSHQKDFLEPKFVREIMTRSNGDRVVVIGAESGIDPPPLMESLFGMILDGLDPDSKRGGLSETPSRVAKAWADWTSGYAKDPIAELKVFEDGAEGADEMVVIRNIPIYSHCEHHLAAIFGTATVGYLPKDKIVGLSKISRVVDIFARRLQVQERMTKQIADCIMEGLNARGAAVVLECRHMCMESRGIRQAGTITTTSALRGLFKTDATVRSEFYSLAHKDRS